MKVEETLPSALNNERLDRIVSLIADISRTDASKLIASGAPQSMVRQHHLAKSDYAKDKLLLLILTWFP